MKNSITDIILKFRALSKIKQFLIILMTIIFIAFISKDKRNSFSKSDYGSTTNSEQTLICDECGTSFQKINGVQLSGHPEVFCSQTCATRWGFAHGISVK